jgi:GntR family transcriptional repressor for pyruvate dehydrogenase complex
VPGLPEYPASVSQVRRPKMAELIANDLRRRIITGELQEGHALPPENTLLARYGVSRPTLREALRVLESEMLIRVHRGARGGARVHAPDGAVAARYVGFVMQYRGITVEDVFRARLTFEPACAGILAGRRTDYDLKLLAEELEAGEREQELTGPSALARHVGFHNLVVELAGNGTMLLLSDMLQDVAARAATNLATTVTPEVLKVGWATAREHHRQVFNLIQARDVEGATAAWRDHLQHLIDRWRSERIGETVLDLLGGDCAKPGVRLDS